MSIHINLIRIILHVATVYKISVSVQNTIVHIRFNLHRQLSIIRKFKKKRKKKINSILLGITAALESSGTMFSEFRSPKSLGLLLQKFQCANTLQSGCTVSL